MKNLIIASVAVLGGLGIMGASASSPKKTLETYLREPAGSSQMYEQICDKDIISAGEFSAYYNSDGGKHKTKWTFDNIRIDEKEGDTAYLDVDHMDRGVPHTSNYAVRSLPGGGHCVEWVNNGRVVGDLNDFIRFPNEQVLAFLPVELSDYYNYDFMDAQTTHMSLRVLDNNLSTSPYIYIPYNGNEELLEYIKTSNKTPVIKGVVGRRYVINLDREKVDKYNRSLDNIERSFDDAYRVIGSGSSSFDASDHHLGYAYTETTDDPSILYMPTAVPARKG